jgi:soluble lytic murein transglycosylase-like protein
MPSRLPAAIAATVLLVLSSPSFAQSTPAAIAPEIVTVGIAPSRAAPAGRPYDALIASHATANGVPAELVHRVVLRESRYQAGVMGRGGASGLMQIKYATARGIGYTGSAAGLLDPDTNLTWGVRYLAGAYRAAGGNPGRAMAYYASGYHGAGRPARAYARMPAQETVFTAASVEPAEVAVQPQRRKRR